MTSVVVGPIVGASKNDWLKVLMVPFFLLALLVFEEEISLP